MRRTFSMGEIEVDSKNAEGSKSFPLSSGHKRYHRRKETVLYIGRKV